MMKAVYLDQHGGVEAVRVGELETPQPGPEDVLVTVRAAALNRLDLWVCGGWPGLKLDFPHVMGADGAGVVHAVGAQVTGFQVGDRVVINPTMSDGTCQVCRSGYDNRCPNFSILGEHVDGTYAEYIAIPARNCLPLPQTTSYETAAAAALVYVTAWHSLITRGDVRPGESVLVVGAGGGVNTAAIQIAKLAGATVYVVGSNAEKLAAAEALGADVLIDRSQEEWSKAVYRLTNKQGVDVVVDNVGAATFQSSLRCLRPGGRLLTVGNTSGPKFEIDNRFLFYKHLVIIGSTMGPAADFRTVMNLVFDGKLRPVIDSIYPLSEAREAMKRMESGDFYGKIVLHVSDD
jgi:NADPH:quinone reductase-like Zn-dependent oxidoreductase